MPRALALLILVALASAVYAQEPVGAPSKLLLRIEGFSGASYWVELVPDSESILYRYNPETFTSAEGTKEEKIDVPKERWSLFWKRLGEVNVWRWKERYHDPNTVDGTVWTVRLEWNGRKAFSSGSNAYPELKQFKMFKTAVSELLGGRKFE